MSRPSKVPTKELITDMPDQFQGDWYIIPTIGDGSCLIHSVLQAVSREYRQSNEKGEIADKIRIGLAYEINKRVRVATPYAGSLIGANLTEEEIEKAGIIFERGKAFEQTEKWFAVGGGVFLNMFYQNINAFQSALNERINDYESKASRSDRRNVKFGSSSSLNKPTGNPNELLIDYSLYGILHLMNSNAYIGDELINLVADYFNVNIVMLDRSGDNTRILHQTIRSTTKDKDFVFVSYSPGHYETVGCRIDDSHYQYCFPHNHELVANFIPSDYDLGLSDKNPDPFSTDRPAFIPPTIADSIEDLSQAVVNTHTKDGMMMVKVDDPAYDSLAEIEGFELINRLSHYAILLHLRDVLITELPSYYNLLRHIFVTTAAFEFNEFGVLPPNHTNIVVQQLWPSIIDAPVIRTNKGKSVPSYELIEQFYGYDILNVMLSVYNLDQNTLKKKIAEHDSIGGVILYEYNLLLTQDKASEQEE